MSFSDPKSKRSASRRSTLCSLVAGIILASYSGPEWLFTIKGCVHLAPEHIEQFIAQMDQDLKGCALYSSSPVADVYHCGDGGAFMLWNNEAKCNDAVADFRAHHRT